jgi:hypothetical protein
LEAPQIWQELAPHYFRQIVLEAAQIWPELAPNYFLTDCFGGSSNLAGTGSTLFSGGLFWKLGFTNLSIGDTQEHPLYFNIT